MRQDTYDLAKSVVSEELKPTFEKFIETVERNYTSEPLDISEIYSSFEARVNKLGISYRFSQTFLFSAVLAAHRAGISTDEIHRQMQALPDYVLTELAEVSNSKFVDMMFPLLREKETIADAAAKILYGYVIHRSGIRALADLAIGVIQAHESGSYVNEARFLNVSEKMLTNEFKNQPVSWALEFA